MAVFSVSAFSSPGDDHCIVQILPIRPPVELSRKWVQLPLSGRNGLRSSLVGVSHLPLGLHGCQTLKMTLPDQQSKGLTSIKGLAIRSKTRATSGLVQPLRGSAMPHQSFSSRSMPVTMQASLFWLVSSEAQQA